MLALLVILSGCRCGAPPAGLDGGSDDVADAGSDGGVRSVFDACDGGRLGAGAPLATGLDGPRRLATDGTDLFISEAGPRSLARGRVLKVPLAGGLVTEVARGLRAPDAIAADGQYVFVLDGDGLWRFGKDGTGRTFLSDVTTNHLLGDTGLLLAGEHVVISTGFEALVRIGRDGAGRVELFRGPPGSAVRSAVMDGDSVLFLVADDGIYEVPLAGGQAQRILGGITSGRALALGAGELFWTEGDRLQSAPRQGGPVRELAAGMNAPARLAVAGQFVYVADATPSGRSNQLLRRVSLCEPKAAISVGPEGIGPADVLFAAETIYFTSAESSPLGYASRL